MPISDNVKDSSFVVKITNFEKSSKSIVSCFICLDIVFFLFLRNFRNQIVSNNIQEAASYVELRLDKNRGAHF